MRRSSVLCGTLDADLAAFLAEHRRFGGMDGGVEGAWVPLRYGCGARLIRRADDD